MGRGDAPTLEVVDEYDADGDGRVTREEYLAGFLRDGIRPVRKSNSRGASTAESWPHAIDATLARRRGGVGSSPLDGAHDSLIDFCAQASTSPQTIF